jgi:hypothetical protein
LRNAENLSFIHSFQVPYCIE